ncbi:bZIP transcription factor [uncultured Tenacibaculum sp.]|uniref:bZIP transcription factor n=1 Tax=uncultured Tenacibaculum sp. TaxID=174713 RepID=UPI0026099B35|nr:bZIP transcription factor [uncultured Tenacibaculum sp.]
MEQYIDNFENYLKSNSKYSIDVRNHDDNTLLHRKLTFAKIKETGAVSLFELLTRYYNRGIKNFFIQKFKPNGTSHSKFEDPLIIKSVDKKSSSVVNETGVNIVHQPAVATPVSSQSTNVANNYPPTQNMFGMNAAAFGMNGMHLTNLMSKADRFDEKVELIGDQKEEIRRLRVKNDELESENRRLKTEVQFAQKEKELELKQLELKDKPILPPDTVTALMGVVGKLIANKSAPVPGMAAPIQEKLSENKEALISLMKDVKFTDQLTQDLINVAIGKMNNQEFSIGLNNLLEKYNLNQSF